MRRSETKIKPMSAGAPVPATPLPRIPVWFLAGLLMLATVAVYWPATRCDFVNFDDPDYVTKNLHVQSGLTLESAKWAFLNPVSANWHPMTTMSHMLDCQLFGLKPWGHHLVNVLLHALNAALVFILLRQLTGAVWRSMLVAALFAVHPLHVESVAWVAERKDVLSGFFGLLSLIFYVRYAQRRSRVERPASSDASSNLALVSRLSSLDYIWALLFLALGLMSKPMLVTWPFVMLLLDYWPLGRVPTSDLRPPTSVSLLALIWEKLPFFALEVVVSYVTFVVQKKSGVVMAIENLPLGARFGNTLVSYCRYLGKLFWPTDLAVFYPHPGYWPLAQVLLAGLLLVAITTFLFVERRSCPFLLVGWLWFCGTLVPVIGLVQVGGQAMADRYAYLPSLGTLILVVWGAYELTRRWRYYLITAFMASFVVVACVGLTRHQLVYWYNSEALFRRALAVTQNNYLAYNNLGDALDRKGESDEAIKHYEEAIRLKPDFAEAHYNLGVAFEREDRPDEAIGQYQEAIRLKPDYAKAHNNLGFGLDRKGQHDEAIAQYQEATRLNPAFAEAYYNLGIALERKGQTAAAISQFQEAIRLAPDNAAAHVNLGIALITKGRYDEAIQNYRQAIQINPNSFEALNNLGVALASRAQLDEAIEEFRKVIQINSNRPEAFVHFGMALEQSGRTEEAVAQYQEALRLNPNLVGALNNLAWVLATSPDAALRNGPEAVRLAERACELTHYARPLFIGSLAAAYAEAGRFPEAVATAEKAEQLAANAGLKAVAAKNRQLLDLYRAGKPYHEPTSSAQQ